MPMRPLRFSDFFLTTALIIFSVLFARETVGLFIAPTSALEARVPVSQTTAVTPAQARATPMRLRITRLGIDTAIQQVGKTASGRMGVPTGENRYQEAGWYNLGFRPGEQGSAVIAGHVDTLTFAPGIFHDLDELERGDIVEVVDAAGQLFRFRVTGSAAMAVDADAAAVFGPALHPRLNLITCTGDWNQDIKMYEERLVVFTELLE